MTALAEIVAGGRPPVLSSTLDSVLRFTLGRLDPPFGSSPLVGVGGRDPYRLKPDDALTPIQRAALEARLFSLDAALRPAGHVAATEEYRRLTGMKAPNATAEEIERETTLFVNDTAGLPAFALREACDAYRLGRIGDGEWMPKVGQVRREAERLAAADRKQRQEVLAVLSAKPSPTENPARKAALLAMARGLVKTMPMEGLKAEYKRTGRTFDEEATRDPQEQRVEESPDAYRASMLQHAMEVSARPMPKASPALRRSLGLPPEVDHQEDRFGSEHAA